MYCVWAYQFLSWFLNHNWCRKRRWSHRPIPLRTITAATDRYLFSKGRVALWTSHVHLDCLCHLHLLSCKFYCWCLTRWEVLGGRNHLPILKLQISHHQLWDIEKTSWGFGPSCWEEGSNVLDGYRDWLIWKIQTSGQTTSLCLKGLKWHPNRGWKKDRVKSRARCISKWMDSAPRENLHIGYRYLNQMTL